MHTVRITQRTGKDGVLHVQIPLGRPEQDFEVVLVVQPTASSPSSAAPEDRGWPPGYFDLAGSINDATFQRPPQGDLPKGGRIGMKIFKLPPSL
jgi:hypothetical protein